MGAPQNGANVRWCDACKRWLRWDAKRWVTDGQRKVESLAEEAADNLWDENGPMLPGMDSGRRSCETQWALAVPQHVVSSWIGHSVAI